MQSYTPCLLMTSLNVRPDPDFLDPVTRELMDDPITFTSTGQTYNRKTIANVFSAPGNRNTVPCPLTRLPIKKSEFKAAATNVIIKKQIEMFISEKKALAEKNKLMKTANLPEEEEQKEGVPNPLSVGSSLAAQPNALTDEELKKQRMKISREALINKVVAEAREAKRPSVREQLGNTQLKIPVIRSSTPSVA